MNIIEKQEDLFKQDPKYALAHCISLDCAMGKGIALTFSRRYKYMRQTLKNIIAVNNITYPDCLLYKDPASNHKIFNLITKEKYFMKPTYDTLETALESMRVLVIDNNVRFLAMPAIGSGLDRLKFSLVKNLIEKTFKDLDIEILICYK